MKYEDNKWRDDGGIWLDRINGLRNWPAIMRDDILDSNRFEYCVPVDIGETLSFWLMKLEDGDFSMPVVVPATTVMIGDFEWEVPFRIGTTTFCPNNTIGLMKFLVEGKGVDRERREKIFREALDIEAAMRLRFLLR